MNRRFLEGKRVAVANSTMTHSARGGEKEVALRHIRALKEAGAYVIYVTNYHNRATASEFVLEADEVVDVKIRPLSPLWCRDLVTFWRFWWLRLDVDILVAHDFPASILCRKAGTTVYYSHAPNRIAYEWHRYRDRVHVGLRWLGACWSWLFRVVDRRIVRPRIEAYMVNSRDVQEKLFRAYGVDAVIISPGVDMPADGDISFEFVLSASRLHKEKEVDKVIGAARSLPHVDFVIAGDGPERQALEMMASSLPNVWFVGRMDQEGLASLYRRCLCVVNASKEEALGMVALEAQAYGKMVIGVRGDGMLEYAGKRTCILLNGNSPEVLAAAIDALWHDVPGVEAMVPSCKQFALGFSWEEHCRKFLDVIREVSS